MRCSLSFVPALDHSRPLQKLGDQARIMFVCLFIFCCFSTVKFGSRFSSTAHSTPTTQSLHVGLINLTVADLFFLNYQEMLSNISVNQTSLRCSRNPIFLIFKMEALVSWFISTDVLLRYVIDRKQYLLNRKTKHTSNLNLGGESTTHMYVVCAYSFNVITKVVSILRRSKNIRLRFLPCLQFVTRVTVVKHVKIAIQGQTKSDIQRKSNDKMDS